MRRGPSRGLRILPVLALRAASIAHAQEDVDGDDSVSYEVTEIATEAESTIVSTISEPVTTHEHVPVTTQTLEQLMLTDGGSPTRDYQTTYTGQEFISEQLADPESAQGMCDDLKTMTAWGTDADGNDKWEWCQHTNTVEIYYYDGYWTDSVEYSEAGTTEMVTTVSATVTSTIATHTLGQSSTAAGDNEPASGSEGSAPGDLGDGVSGSESDDLSSGGSSEPSSDDSSVLSDANSASVTSAGSGSSDDSGGGGGGVLTLFSTMSVDSEQDGSAQQTGSARAVQPWPRPALFLTLTVVLVAKSMVLSEFLRVYR